MAIDTNAASDHDSTRDQRRSRMWLLLVAALLTIGCMGAIVALDRPGRELNSIGLVGTAEESGWWTQISIEEARPATPAAPETPAVVQASVPTDVLFAESSATLDDNAREALRGLAAQLAQSTGPIVIGGHTDLRGDAVDNMRLGQDRAEAVAALLVELGAPAARIDTSSFGETQPICEQVNPDGSDNADCRARCRRVVVAYAVTTAS
jgi:outer membrane protein OmpA-like peptidoglycan-associated protein